MCSSDLDLFGPCQIIGGMTASRWQYPPELVTLLESHGISPTPDTHPRMVRDYLSGLYRVEIRQLRDDHRAGKIRKADYIPRVIELRRKYVSLSLTPAGWEEAFKER